MSYTYPRQLKGIGMSRMAANQEVENSYYLDINKVGLDQLLAPDNSWVREQFVARINTALTTPLEAAGGIDVRWTYNLTRQVWPATTSQHQSTIIDPDGLTFTGYNLCEWFNGSGILGDGTDIANLPPNTYLVPVTGNVLVTVYRMQKTLSSTDIVYLFDRNNGYECPPEGGDK